MSTIFFDTVIVTSEDSTTSRVMLGGSVSNLNDGVTTAQQGLLVPSGGQQNSLPQLTATAYLQDEVVEGISFLWESSNPCVCVVDQNGNCTRVTNSSASSYDSNGGVSTGQLGGLAQITATALRPDGSQSGVRRDDQYRCAGPSPRQYVDRNGNSGAASSPSSASGFYDLVD